MNGRSLSVEEAADQAASPSQLAGLLRWLGAFALAASAVVFLLQGLDGVDLVIRNWSYLLLMAVLGGSGYATRIWLEDAVSARLLLAGAVALVPVQFAQLGGLLHGLASAESSLLTSLYASEPLSLPALALLTVVSLLACFPVAYLGFSILVRPAARRLTGLLLLPVVMLLLPWRESFAGFAVLAVLLVQAMVTDRRLAGSDLRFCTAEGRVARWILLLPLMIATARMGFHVDELSGFCALAGLTGVALIAAARMMTTPSFLAEILLLLGILTGSAAWLLWSGVQLTGFSAWFPAPLIFGPVIAALLLIASFSRHGRVYRGTASLICAGMALALITSSGVWGCVLSLLAGGLLAWTGMSWRLREPTLTGTIIIAVALFSLSVEAFAAVSVSGWIALALSGVALVLCASLLEKYGRVALARFGSGWRALASWQ